MISYLAVGLVRLVIFLGNVICSILEETVDSDTGNKEAVDIVLVVQCGSCWLMCILMHAQKLRDHDIVIVYDAVWHTINHGTDVGISHLCTPIIR